MRFPIALCALALVLFLFTGSFGVVRIEDCAGMAAGTEKMGCYHLAAVGEAYEYNGGQKPEKKSEAVVTCFAIEDEIGGAFPENSDTRRAASVEKNSCLYDVARAARDSSICDDMKDASIGWDIFGSDVTSDMCRQEVGNLEQATYENYNRNSLCSLVLIFPLLLAVAVAVRHGIKQ